MVGEERGITVPGKSGWASLEHSLQRSTENPLLYPQSAGWGAIMNPTGKAQSLLSRSSRESLVQPGGALCTPSALVQARREVI